MTNFYEIPNFFNNFEKVRKWFDNAEYNDLVNPVDGLVYPDICLLNEDIAAQVVAKVNEHSTLGSVRKGFMFARRSLLGVKPPHSAHTDLSMARFGCFVYLNRPEHCVGGTSAVKHIETGLSTHPINQEEVDLWARDTNKFDMWSIVDMCEMESNKGMIFETVTMHRSESPHGFGTTAKDGRLVLIFFFELENGL